MPRVTGTEGDWIKGSIRAYLDDIQNLTWIKLSERPRICHPGTARQHHALRKDFCMDEPTTRGLPDLSRVWITSSRVRSFQRLSVRRFFGHMLDTKDCQPDVLFRLL